MDKLFRLRKEAGGYLSVEIIGISKQDCIEQFASWAMSRTKRSGGDWAPKDIEDVVCNQDKYIEEVTPGIRVDGEDTFVTVRTSDIAKGLKAADTDGYGLGYFASLYGVRVGDAKIDKAQEERVARLQARMVDPPQMANARYAPLVPQVDNALRRVEAGDAGQ